MKQIVDILDFKPLVPASVPYSYFNLHSAVGCGAAAAQGNRYE